MVLGEAYLRNILRPPPVDASALPANPAHPFQKSFMFYLRQRFLKHHTPLLFGYAVSLYVFSQLDGAMKNGKKKAFDKAIEEGHSPCA